MSTYNGEKYLEQQINSIFSQKNCDVYLYIRDDGSTDRTIKIINNFISNGASIHLNCGQNIGYERSFMELVYTVSDRFEYYAFADQDDVWMPEKVISAITMLKADGDIPALYYGMMTETDSNLVRLEKQQTFKEPLSKKMVLFQNFVQGSTIVFNNKMLIYAQKYKIKYSYPHDVWLPILATYIGKIFGDTNSYILYRRHEDSVTIKMKKKYWKELMLDIFKGKIVRNYSIPLLEGYIDILEQEDLKFLEILYNYKKNKFYLLKDKNVRKYSIKGTIMLKSAILFNRIEVSK